MDIFTETRALFKDETVSLTTFLTEQRLVQVSESAVTIFASE